MAIKIHIHSEAVIEAALIRFQLRPFGGPGAVLEVIETGLRESDRLAGAWRDLHPLTAAELQRLMARQIAVDLAEFVLPRIPLLRNPAKVLADQLGFELLLLPAGTFVRWLVADPQRYLVGAVDQLALAAKDLPDRIAHFDEEGNRTKTMARHLGQKFAAAGLPPVERGSDLTVDHVLFLGVLLSVRGYHIVPGQPILPVIRSMYRTHWKTLTNPAAKKHVENVTAKAKTKVTTRGYGTSFEALAERAERAVRGAILQQREEEARERRVAREAREQAQAERRERARRLREEAAAAARMEALEREERQRVALEAKSERDRLRWQEARAQRAAAEASIDARNKELLAEYKRRARQRREERTQARVERLAREEALRRSALAEHLAALPDELQDSAMRALVTLMQRDAREYEPSAEELQLACEQDRRLRLPPFDVAVDPDFRGLVETWLRNELHYDAWLEHVEGRERACRERLAELRLEEAQRHADERRVALEEAREREARRWPGTAWSRHLNLLEALSTDERLERLKSSGWVGPPSGFATLERHLRGETTSREQRLYARERWLDIGSAFAELRTLERFAFYRVAVRFASELPGVFNPDLLVIDTLSSSAAGARIRPLEIKKIYLDRAEEGRDPQDNALHHFTSKLLKADKQLAEGMARYGGYDRNRRATGFADGRGGTALFVLQNRRAELLTNSTLERCHAAFIERIQDLDQERSLEAVDCVIVYLDYLRGGALFQRPMLSLHRDGIAPGGWTTQDPYIDHLVSEHDVQRSLQPPLEWLEN